MEKHVANIRTFLVLLLYITFVLFVISPDSYTHDLYGRSDSSWFFMCGKAWMNGLQPYVDFTDSKGPLLWLIYGCGYLMDHYTYIGIFWISCLTYALTLYSNFQTVLLLTNDRKKSFWVTVSMILPYFLYWCHYEIRAEDFCLPVIAGGIYYLVASSQRPVKSVIIKAGIFLGVGLVVCFLIKWSIAAMYLSFLFSVGYLAAHNKHLNWYVGALMLGMSLLAIPFLTYFLISGNLSAFIQEYLVHTAQSVNLSLSQMLITYAKEWGLALSGYKLIYLFYALSIYQLSKERSAQTYLLLFCCLFFFALSIRNDLLYYTTVMAPFGLFAILFIFRYLNKFYTAIFVMVIVAFQLRNLDAKANLFFQNDGRQAFYTAAYVMSQKDKPTLINEWHEFGIGTPVDALPGTRYWAKQNGESEEMTAERYNDIRKGKADFVTCFTRVEKGRNTVFFHALQEGGYVYYCTVPYRDTFIDLYGKPGYQLPDASFSVTDADILSKRRLFH